MHPPVDAHWAALAQAGWTVTPAAHPQPLPPALATRYPRLEPAVAQALMSLDDCVNPSETAWLLTATEFSQKVAQPFAWNAWEQLSLAAAGEDARWCAQIRRFWDQHLPVLLSVQNGYGYCAVGVAGPHAGQVVQGFEPEFEECTVAFPSFDAFLSALVAAARGEACDALLAQLL